MGIKISFEQIAAIFFILVFLVGAIYIISLAQDGSLTGYISAIKDSFRKS